MSRLSRGGGERCAVLSVFAVAVTVLVVLAAVSEALAQASQNSVVDPDTGIRQPQYYLSPGLEDELNIRVQIWGEVRIPGLYVVADGTDLIEAISLAGGPTQDASLSRVKVIRFTSERRGVIDVDVSEYIGSASENATLRLQPNDTINVPARFWPKVGRWTGLVATMALIASVVVNASK